MPNIELCGQGSGVTAALGQPVCKQKLVGQVHLPGEVSLSHRRVRSVGNVGHVVHDGFRKPGQKQQTQIQFQFKK